MAEENEDLGEVDSALAMSDEDIMNMSEPPGDGGEDFPTEEEDDGVVHDDNGSEQQPAAEGGSNNSGDDPDEGDQASGESDDSESEDEPLTGEDDGLQEEGQEQAASKEEIGEEGADPAEPAAAKIDFEAEYNRLLAPFKANGHQMQVNNVDDALTLMQMGANYNKKMAGLKPSLRMLKMLEKNELLDEDKINNLIDLSKQNPAAIQDLFKKSGIDPLDIDLESEDEYQPETYTVDDKEVDLDGVLEDIKDTPSFDETLDIISNKWDGASKRILLENPGVIKIINGHVESGIYKSIHEIVENERALGRLTEMSDIQAYKHVGDVIQANGGFAPEPGQTGQPAPQPQANAAPAPVSTKKDPKLKSRKRAAGSPKGSPGSAPQEFNPLDMSDEDFEKATANMRF